MGDLTDKELDEIEAIRKREGQYCSWAQAYRIYKTGSRAAPSAPTDEKERLKAEIMAEIKGDKTGFKFAESLENFKQRAREEDNEMRRRIREEDEARQKEIEVKAREMLLGSKLKASKDDDENNGNDGLPKDPLARAAYQAAVQNITEALKGGNKAKGFEMNHETISSLGEILTNITGQITRTVDQAGHGRKSEIFIRNMGWIIRELKAGGFEKDLTLGQVIEIMRLSQGAITTPPEGVTAIKSRKDIEKELTDDVKGILDKIKLPENEDQDDPNIDKVT